MRQVLIVVLLAVAVVAGLVVAVGFYVARDPEYYCLVDIIRNSGVSATDTVVDVESRLSLLPLGTECTFVTDDGARLVVEPGWIATVLALAAVASATTAAYIAVFMPRQRSSWR